MINLMTNNYCLAENLHKYMFTFSLGKGRGAVIINSSRYPQKYLQILENNQFSKINNNPMKRIKSKTQRCVPA